MNRLDQIELENEFFNVPDWHREELNDLAKDDAATNDFQENWCHWGHDCWRSECGCVLEGPSCEWPVRFPIYSTEEIPF